jgi:hypothetical protein
MPRLTSLTSKQLTGVGITYSSPAPLAQYFGIELNASTYNEGATVTATVTTAGIADGTTVGYAVTGVSTNDISAGSLTGNITINSNTGTVSWTLSNDGLTEGTDTFTVTLAAQDSTANATGSLSDSATVVDTSNNPNTTLWLDNNDAATTVRSVIGGFSMQINGVFSSNPPVPIAIQGRTSGTRTTITAISARTSTYIEVDDTGNSTNFAINEQLNRFDLTNSTYVEPTNFIGGGSSQWNSTTFTVVTASNNSLAAALRSATTGKQFWFEYDGASRAVVTLAGSFTETVLGGALPYRQFTATVSESSPAFRSLTNQLIILP